MDKRVIVIASGETERRALPHLVRHLRDMGIKVSEVRIPRRNLKLSVRMAERLIKAAWYGNSDAPPDKFVVLIDTDGKAPDNVIGPFKERLPGRLGGDIGAAVQFAYAQRHLEAWYFGDEANLRCYLGGMALGNVDPSKPDAIQNPKLHLKNLLGSRVYTAHIAEEIARELDAHTIVQRSSSFKVFTDAVINGDFRPGSDNA